MNQNRISDSVENRRRLARSLVPSNLQALRQLGMVCESVDGDEYRVAGKVAFFPKIGFWRFLDGSRQGYGAGRLIPELLLGDALAAPAVEPTPSVATVVHLPKPAAGRDSDANAKTSNVPVIAESAAGPSSRLLPAVMPCR